MFEKRAEFRAAWHEMRGLRKELQVRADALIRVLRTEDRAGLGDAQEAVAKVDRELTGAQARWFALVEAHPCRVGQEGYWSMEDCPCPKCRSVLFLEEDDED